MKKRSFYTKPACWLCSALLGLVLIAGCGGSGAISGKVAVNYTGQPVYNAIVKTEPATSAVTTDLEGRYTIPNVRAGWYRVIAVHGPEATASTKVRVMVGKTTTADLVLWPKR